MRTTDGYELAYDIQGSGPAPVLLPGALMHRHWWHELGYVERLAARFTVINIDPLGHGESDRPHDPDAHTNDRLVDHVLGVLEAERMDRFAMWGFSRGAAMASLVTRAVPERVDLAVLGSGPPDGSAFPDDIVDSLRAGDWGPSSNSQGR